MKSYTGVEKRSLRQSLFTVCVAALVVACMIALPQPAQAAKITPPPVPTDIEVPAGHEVYLVGHAIGTQNYVCVTSTTAPSGFAYTLFTPQATLFNDKKNKDVQISTHFFSPNPDQGGTVRATWQDSKDTSAVWGQVMPGDSSTDPAFVAPGAIPWLLVTVVGAEDGPTGGTSLSKTTYIQRLNTGGGIAPASGCAALADVGKQAFVPYTADYFFFRAAKK